MKKRGLGLHYFQLFERRNLIQDSDVLAHSLLLLLPLLLLLNEFMTQSLRNTVEYVAQIQDFQHISLSTLSQLGRPKASC